MSIDFWEQPYVVEQWQPENHFLHQNAFQKQRINEALKPHLETLLKGKGKVLNIGAGGGLRNYWTKDYADLMETDISHLMLKRSEKSKLKLQTNAEMGLPFADETFKGVVQLFVNRYFEESGQIKNLKEIMRVLEKGGKFVILDFSDLSPSSKTSGYNSLEKSQFIPERLIKSFGADIGNPRIVEVMRIGEGIWDPVSLKPSQGDILRGKAFLFSGTKNG